MQAGAMLNLDDYIENDDTMNRSRKIMILLL